MRASEDRQARTFQRLALKQFIQDNIRLGESVAIERWYAAMQGLGLVHSHRQRLSELRKEGLQFTFSRTSNSYTYNGWFISEQPSFELSENDNGAS